MGKTLAYGQEDDQLVMEWQTAFNECSFKMIQSLIDYQKRTLSKLENNIDNVEKQILEKNEPQISQKKFNVLKLNTKKVDDIVAQRKAEKFRRDQKDYAEGKSSFQQKKNQRLNSVPFSKKRALRKPSMTYDNFDRQGAKPKKPDSLHNGIIKKSFNTTPVRKETGGWVKVQRKHDSRKTDKPVGFLGRDRHIEPRGRGGVPVFPINGWAHHNSFSPLKPATKKRHLTEQTDTEEEEEN